MVYCLEDDKSILELILYALSSQHIESRGFLNVEDFYVALQERVPEVVILDIMLGSENGLEILKKLKQQPHTRHITIIMLSALEQEMDKVRGLDLGADDYIAKPFGVMELIARVKVALRRTDSINKKDWCLDELEFSYKQHKASINGKSVQLTLKEFSLLGFLLENKGQVFSRDEILESLWGYGYDGQNRTLDVHIKTLRKKLGSFGKRIESIRGVGYTLR